MKYHDPVLLDAAVDGLAIEPNAICIDVTFGGGGHSRAILEKLVDGRLIVPLTSFCSYMLSTR